MADESSSKQMITEDEDLRSTFVAVMRRHVSGWSSYGPKDAPVFVRRADGAEHALTLIGTVWKTSRLEYLGVIIDADDQLAARWAKISRFAEAHFSPVPAKPPPEGLILTDGSGKRFGAWIMPDNNSAGMLETFCHPLVPAAHEPLWRYAETVAKEAKARGGSYIKPHFEKAHLHTFLAWIDPPGQSIGRAITTGCLDCCAYSAVAFVRWCKALYQL